jgi:hypothetical protein
MYVNNKKNGREHQLAENEREPGPRITLLKKKK